MNVLLGLLIVLVVTALTSAAMLLVRRRAPEGSDFADGDRASGVFGVLATGFSVLLGFIIFLSFQSYDSSRAGAEAEATIVAQQIETAQFFADDEASASGELVCYARSVAGVEWDALDNGSLEDAINPWSAELFFTMKGLDPTDPAQQSAYDRFLDQTTDRQQARNDRVRGVEGVIPLPVWLALFVISGVVFAYMLFFADRAERALTQAMLMGSVTVVITLLLLLVAFFDEPHGDGVGRLQPTAMERTLRIIDAELDAANVTVTPPCNEVGVRGCDGGVPGRASLQEVLVTILLVVAAVATSWSSYQATRWNGEQAEAASRTNALRIDGARAASLSEAETEIDVATFIAWADADRSGNESLAAFYVDRFRPEFATAFDTWQATDPLTNAEAPKTPFALPGYRAASAAEAARIDVAAEASAAEVRRNIQRASNYVLTVVLYAIVLFFAGISTRLRSRRLRWVTTISGYVVLVGALAWIATFPVSLKI